MKSLLLLFVAFAWLTVFSNSVLACQCLDYEVPVCSAFWTTSTVFVGQLRDITPPPKSTSPDTWPMATLHFIVEQPFRGVKGAIVDVETSYGTMCDHKFRKGSRYLVYADEDSESHKLLTGFCDRTRELANADDDLSYIRSVMQQNATESILGILTNFNSESSAGAKIEVRNDSKTFEATSDEKGHFSIPVNGPGAYTIRVAVPAPIEAMSVSEEPLKGIETTDTRSIFEYKVNLQRGECNYRKFELIPVDVHATARISGVVLAGSDEPLNKGRLYLLKKEDSPRFKAATIEANGSFKFKDVAVGEYFLTLNPDNDPPDEDDPPYARAFYPNATDFNSATKIVVTEGAKLENLVLRVGPALEARTVSGRVVYKGGGRVKNAHISLYNGERYLRRIDLDKEGRFNFYVYGDFNYAIAAQKDGARDGKSDRIVLQAKTTGITLVLKPD